MAGVRFGVLSILPLVASGGAVASIDLRYSRLTLASLFWAIASVWLLVVWILEVKDKKLSYLPQPIFGFFAVSGVMMPIALMSSQFSEAGLEFAAGTLLVWTIFLTSTFEKDLLGTPKVYPVAIGLAGIVPGAALIIDLMTGSSNVSCLTCFAASQITPQIALASLGLWAFKRRNHVEASLFIALSLIISVTIVLSGSRAASLLSMVLLAHVLASVVAKGRYSWILTAVIAPIFASTYLLWATSKIAIGQRWTVVEGDISIPTLGGEAVTIASSGRLAMWGELLSEPLNIVEFFFGRGVGASEFFARNLFSGGSWNSVHNDYLALWYDTGLVGFASVVSVCAFAVIYAVKSKTSIQELDLSFSLALSFLWLALFESPSTSIYVVFPLAVLAYVGEKVRWNEPF